MLRRIAALPERLASGDDPGLGRTEGEQTDRRDTLKVAAACALGLLGFAGLADEVLGKKCKKNKDCPKEKKCKHKKKQKNGKRRGRCK